MALAGRAILVIFRERSDAETLPRWKCAAFSAVGMSLLPGLDALDDEEVLARADESQPARLACERVAARGELEPVLQGTLLGGQPPDLGTPRGELVTRLEPAPQGVVVGVADRHDQQHGKPTPRERGEGWTT